jgi:formate/nitrite transporter FocA (FNT family)
VNGRNVGLCIIGNLVGALLVAAAWIGASGATTLAGQTPSLNLGVVGLVVSGVANAHLLAQAHRQIEARTRRVLGRLAPVGTEP